jgi:N-formylglutamate deformylase
MCNTEPIFDLSIPVSPSIPMLVSIVHSGTEITSSFAGAVRNPGITLPDTDWYLHQLYDFCIELGVPVIRARYSRYIIDLNRPLPWETSLYTDRTQTSLTPLKTFDGQDIYKAGREPSDDEIKERINQFYKPYYARVKQILESFHSDIGTAFLFDAHSIRSQVPSISAEPFTDFVLGNRKGVTCPMILLAKGAQCLKAAGYSVSLNHPFQGGNITRHFHKTLPGTHCLQLEMSQKIYMDEKSREKLEPQWTKTSAVLSNLLSIFKAEMTPKK